MPLLGLGSCVLCTVCHCVVVLGSLLKNDFKRHLCSNFGGWTAVCGCWSALALQYCSTAG